MPDLLAIVANSGHAAPSTGKPSPGVVTLALPSVGTSSRPVSRAPSLQGLRRSRDTTMWRLEANERELRVVQRERAVNEDELAEIDAQIRAFGKDPEVETTDDEL